MGLMTIFIWEILVRVLLATLVKALFCSIVYRDTKRYSDAAWKHSGQNKLLWILLSFFFDLIGLLIYFIVIAPKVRRAERAIVFSPAPGYAQVA